MKPMLRVIFDRKNKASETTAALIQIEVYFKGKRKYISTGVKVRSNEWDKDRNRVSGSRDDFNNNYYITSLLKKIDDFIVDCDRNNDEFSLSKLDAFLQGSSDGGQILPRKVIEAKNETQYAQKNDNNVQPHRKVWQIKNPFRLYACKHKKF